MAIDVALATKFIVEAKLPLRPEAPMAFDAPPPTVFDMAKHRHP